MSDIVISEFMDEAPLAALRERFTVRYARALVDDRAALCDSVGEARALIVRNRTRVDPTLLDAAPNLRVIGRLGVGLDNIDLAACEARNVKVLPATGANDLAVAEYVIAAALMLLRPVFAASASVAAGQWPRAASIGREIAGQTLALVGFGNVARQVAERAVAMDMRVIAHDPNIGSDHPCWARCGVNPVGFDDVLTQADVLSLHVPRVEETRHLIDAAALARMKSSAVLVNSARGGVLDDDALARALRSGVIAAAAVDVFETEPLPAASVYAALDNVLLTPHIAGITEQSNRRVSRVTVDNVLSVLGEVSA